MNTKKSRVLIAALPMLTLVAIGTGIAVLADSTSAAARCRLEVTHSLSHLLPGEDDAVREAVCAAAGGERDGSASQPSPWTRSTMLDNPTRERHATPASLR
jgi:hypothetical protein